MAGNIGLMAAGVAMTLMHPVFAVVAGIAGVTAGFFGAHSVASAWVGFSAVGARAQASALYLLAYYAGSSIVGSAVGLIWTHAGWNGVAGCNRRDADGRAGAGDDVARICGHAAGAGRGAGGPMAARRARTPALRCGRVKVRAR